MIEGGRQIADETINAIRQIALKGFEPDLTFYLDVDPAEGLARARGRGELDRIELSGLDFFTRTRQRYLQLAQQSDTIKVIDAMQPMAQVHSDIIASFEQVFT